MRFARPSGNLGRYLTLAVVLLSAVLVWWAVMVRLTDSSLARRGMTRQQQVEFQLNQLRWRRDDLSGPEGSTRQRKLDALLVADPRGMVSFLDELRTLGSQVGMRMRYSVGDRQPSEFEPAVGWQDIQLNFAQVDYAQVLKFLTALHAREEQRLFTVRNVQLNDQAGSGSLSGQIGLRVWTRQSLPESGAESLDLQG